MSKDDRPVLDLLKDELAFVEQGGYGHGVSRWLQSRETQQGRKIELQ
jgi:hypothetical protein